MNLDLSTLSLGDLKAFQKEVAKAIESVEGRRKAEALTKVEALAKSLGFSLADVVGPAGKTHRMPVAAKYRNPSNPADTWSGRGLHPGWYKAHVASGGAADDLLVG